MGGIGVPNQETGRWNWTIEEHTEGGGANLTFTSEYYQLFILLCTIHLTNNSNNRNN